MTEALHLQPEPIKPWELPIICGPRVAADFNEKLGDVLLHHFERHLILGTGSEIVGFDESPAMGIIARLSSGKRLLEVYNIDNQAALVATVQNKIPRGVKNGFGVKPFIKTISYDQGRLTFSEGATYELSPTFRPFRDRLFSSSLGEGIPALIQTQEPTPDELMAEFDAFMRAAKEIIDASQRPAGTARRVGERLLSLVAGEPNQTGLYEAF